MSFEIIKSKRGNDILKYNGFLYRKEKTIGEKKIWRCLEYDSTKCVGRCHTVENRVIKFTDNHNHIQDQADIEKRKVIQNLKNAALSTQNTTTRILADSLILNPSVSSKLPKLKSLKRTIQRQREISNKAPGNPENLRELIIPLEFTLTLKNEEFLLFDSGPSDNRILIFSTKFNLNQLSQSEHWYADGTFKVVPKLFWQLYTIHGIKFNNVIPSVFILMTNKSEETYKRAFEALKNLQNNLKPLTIMTDFEFSAINAFKYSFPGIFNRGCFFHFTQNLWRKIQKIPELQAKYLENSDFAMNMRKIPALAFVPIDDIIFAFEELIEMKFFIENSNLLEKFIEYFEDNYIGRIQLRNRRKTPKFPHYLWNCYNSVINGIAKTNNSVEGWHRKFSNLLEADHPSIWKFINGLKREQNLNEVQIDKYLSGEEPEESRPIYRQRIKNLKNIVGSYNKNNLDDYLTGIANNFNFNV
jgi:hypothetical protein